MFEWYPSHPEFQPYLARAHQERAEAMSRAAYLAVLAVDWLSSRAVRAVVAGLRRIARAYGVWQRRRLTVRELSRLDERMLRDIGIVTSSSIEAIAAELVSKEPVRAPRRAPVVALPQPRLDVDCPDLKHAA